jgi:hypothetical protein
VDGEKQIYLLGFGWIKDEGGSSVGTMAGNPGDQLTGNKVGIMGGGTTVDGKGDINKQVGIMGGGTVAEDMYENGNKIGIMGGGECPSSDPASAHAVQPEITGDVIYTELQPPVTKDSTPPTYKPNGEPYKSVRNSKEACSACQTEYASSFCSKTQKYEALSYTQSVQLRGI